MAFLWLRYMNLQKVLSPSVVKPVLEGSTKGEIIDELLSLLVATGGVSDKKKARASLFERERKMSTGMQHGIAIPHGKTSAVTTLLACIGVSRSGVEFDSLDGQPAHIFVMTLSPLDRTGPHIEFLAEVSNLLKEASRREALLAAQTAEEILSVFTA